MSDASTGAKRIAVVTVHGTGDTADSATGDKWFQNGSTFVTGLKARLTARGVEADVHPHFWSGANSAAEREKGARSLAKLVRKLAKSHDGVHVIGHSHGGNVANDAACMLNWSRAQKRPKLASVTTVGTPFFRTLVTRSEVIGAWAFGAMALISTFVLLPVLLLVIVAAVADPTMFSIPADTDPQQRVTLEQTRTMVVSLLSAGVAGLAALVFIFPLAFRGLLRIRRANRRAKQTASILAIRHAEDEAISFLRRVETMPIEPFPRGSVLRGSRTGAIVWGIRAVLTIPLVGIFLMLTDGILAMAGQEYHLPPFFGATFNSTLALAGMWLLLFGLVGAPIVFGAVYVIYRLFAGTAGELAFRDSLNGIVSGALRGLAFGRDGDTRIGDVSPNSHYFHTLCYILAGDVATRMVVASNDASRRLFEKYRRGVFSSEADQNDVLNEIAKDALTWEALVHTTYFDQPEMIDLCSSYIANVAQGAEPAATEPLRAANLEECPKPSRSKLFIPLLKTALTVAIGCTLVGAAVVFASPLINRDHVAREGFRVLSHGSYVAGQVLRDCEGCPDLVVVTGGVFTMGSPTSEFLRNSDEGPLRRVTIAPFAAGRYEVTFDQWEACEAAGACRREFPFGSLVADPGLPRGAHPIVNVTWQEAHQYTAWLSQTTGHTYRLLSEAEWEYVARSGSNASYSWGDEFPNCDSTAVNGAAFHDGTEGCADGSNREVGTFQPNAFGLYDMHGNVAEWVEDCYATTYFGRRTDAAPFVRANCADGHVIRGQGGYSWNTGGWNLRSASRDYWLDAGGPSDKIGFRVARDLRAAGG
jgi:formylglycine-generating enzyme required for sulfatase activity